MTEIYQQKKALRDQIKGYKKNVSVDELHRKSELVIANLKKYNAFINAKTVMLYWSLPDEVDTQTLISELLKTKTVILPTVVKDDIIPVKLTHTSELHEGEFHILEPKNREFIGKIDLIVVPGVAFDRCGNRLGRGRGFYDRFLQHQTAETVGTCFDFQLVEQVPTEPNDIPLKKNISENNW